MKNCASNRTPAGHNLGAKYPLVRPSQLTDFFGNPYSRMLTCDGNPATQGAKAEHWDGYIGGICPDDGTKPDRVEAYNATEASCTENGYMSLYCLDRM